MSNHSRLLRVACSTAFVLLAMAARAQASLIPITIGAFSASAHVADFTVASNQPLPYSEDGATFASFSGFASNVLGFNDFLFLAGTGTLRVNFSDPEIRAGFLFTNATGPSGVTATLSVQAFSDLLGTLPLGTLALGSFAGNQSGFVGFQADALFSRVDISFSVPTQTASYFIDDFRFEPTAVPEPATMVLTLLGAGWLGRQARRRRR